MDLHETRQQEEQNKMLQTITTENIITLLERKKNDVLNGDEDGYKLMLFIKKFEEKLKYVKSDILEVVISETTEKLEWNGHRFENTAGGRYDYSESEEWNKLNNAKKQIEKDMQIAAKSKHDFISEDGEIIQPAIYKPNKTSVKITKLLTK